MEALPETRISVRLPALKPGCVMETLVRVRRLPNSQIPGISHELVISDNVPILDYQFTFDCRRKANVHYKVLHLPDSPITSAENYSQVYKWNWKDLPEVDHLQYDPPLGDVQGCILLSSFKDWRDFSQWYCRLAAGSDVVSDPVKACAARLTSGLISDHDKLRALYDEVSQIRYVAIEIGVGAFRPRTPDWVLQNNFGDCKDKANLLIALAKQVGISGQFVLLNRDSRTDLSFPGLQFNHALAYFPSVDGGVWLDSTDGATPYGQLPPGDVGRDGLILADDPTFHGIPIPPAQATQLNETLRLDFTGKGPSQFTADATGITDFEVRETLRNLTAPQTDNYFRESLKSLFPGATLRNYSFSDVENLEVPLHVEWTFDPLPGTGAEMARFKLPMDLLGATMKPARTLPLVLNDAQPFSVEQTVDLIGLTPDNIPAETTAQTPDGTASVTYSTTPEGFQRKLVINVTNPTISPENYPAFRAMILKIFLSILKSPSAKLTSPGTGN